MKNVGYSSSFNWLNHGKKLLLGYTIDSTVYFVLLQREREGTSAK